MDAIKRAAWLMGAMCWGLATPANADVTPGTITTYSTPQSIGIEWDITDDVNHEATVSVEYRVAGTTDWSDGMPLFRIDFGGRDMLAGSILFVDPDTEYEIRLVLADAGGDVDTQTTMVRTGAVPTLPSGGTVLHVAPGNGGGSGTEADPYLGIAAAQQNASSGDTFMVHAGDYGGPITFDQGGSGSDHIAWVAAGDGPARIGGVRIEASGVWLEGFDITLPDNAVRGGGGTSRVVIKRNTVTGCHYCVHLSRGDSGWWISDNTIVGDEPPTSGSFSGEGIELQQTPDHTVAYNSISMVADGISYPERNVDIFGNDIFETSDDGIEPDYGFENIRIWGNRIHHANHNGITFQPQNSAPWYVLRNQIVGSSESVLKMRTTDRVLVAHNTFVGWTRVIQNSAGLIRNMTTRNNMLVSMTGDYIIEDTGSTGLQENWRTDLDYDGFAWGMSNLPKFKWHDIRYDDVAAFVAATGHQANGLELPLSCFETLDVPGAPPAVIPPQWMTLDPGCAAVDAGQVLPNVNDRYVGNGPDMGAHEVGAPLQHYGPRGGDPDGGPCTMSGDCQSGQCVDGVCCESTCGGGATDDCQACSVMAGGPADGTCGPIEGCGGDTGGDTDSGTGGGGSGSASGTADGSDGGDGTDGGQDGSGGGDGDGSGGGCGCRAQAVAAPGLAVLLLAGARRRRRSATTASQANAG